MEDKIIEEESTAEANVTIVDKDYSKKLSADKNEKRDEMSDLSLSSSDSEEPIIVGVCNCLKKKADRERKIHHSTIPLFVKEETLNKLSTLTWELYRLQKV